MHKLFEIPSFTLFLCAFCAFLWLTRTVFSQLLKKAVSMALRSKASLCVKSSLLEQSLPRTPSRPKTSMISVNPVILSNFSSCPNAFVAKTPRNQRNPRLINDLRACKALYICRDSSTDIESPLQINLFMQNKANFQKVKLNVNKVLTKDYEQIDTWSIGKTKPIQSQFKANQSQSKPIQSQLKPIKCQNKAKQTQSQNRIL